MCELGPGEHHPGLARPWGPSVLQTSTLVLSPLSARPDSGLSTYSSQSQGSVSLFCAYFQLLEIGLRKDIMFPLPENVFFPLFGFSLLCSALSVNTHRETSPDIPAQLGFPRPLARVPLALGHSTRPFVAVHRLASPGRGHACLAPPCLTQSRCSVNALFINIRTNIY